MPKTFWQYHMKNFYIPKKQTGQGLLVQNVKPIGRETTLLDPFKFDSLMKIPQPLSYHIYHPHTS